MKSSIRTQIMTAFIVILTLTMVLCIGLNNGLLKDFYYQKKQEKVVHYYEKLDQLTNNKSENDSIAGRSRPEHQPPLCVRCLQPLSFFD